MDDRPAILQLLNEQLARATAMRAAAGADPALAETRARLRGVQADRLARTHADLLASPRFGKAAAFFLSDIYGPRDLGPLYAETGKVVPVMARLLPTAGLSTVAHAIELDALSEDLDLAVARAMGTAKPDAAAYRRAYRQVGRRPDRERQIRLVETLGATIDHLARLPLIGRTLRMMRLPARLAGLGDLQDFLERGYAAFHGTADVDEFLRLITTREWAAMEALFAAAA